MATALRARAGSLAGRLSPGLTSALVVGFVLRLAFALAATPDSFMVYSEPYEYLSYASSISDLAEYRINGHVTAFFPAGWPLAIAPISWVSRHTGWFLQSQGATVLCAVIGTYTVWASARLAEQWLGPRSKPLVAWLVALAPALIIVTATPLVETMYTAVVLTLLLPLARLLEAAPFRLPTARSSFAYGLLAGYLILVRSSGIVVLLLVVAWLWRRARGQAPIRRTVGIVLLGIAVLVVPMTLRNGLAVHFWSPFSTNQAGAMCLGHHDGSTGGITTDEAVLYDCHWGAPQIRTGWTPTIESRWARRAPIDAIHWAISHPRQEVGLTAKKTYLVLGQDRNAGALSFTADEHAIPEHFIDPLLRAIEAWRWIMLTLAAAALLRSKRCRGAYIIWATPTAMFVIVYAGAVGARMNLPLLPFVAILASTVLLPDTTEQSAGPAPEPVEAGDPAPGAALNS